MEKEKKKRNLKERKKVKELQGNRWVFIISSKEIRRRGKKKNSQTLNTKTHVLGDY